MRVVMLGIISCLPLIKSEVFAAPVTQTFVIDATRSGYTIGGTSIDSLGNSFPLVEQFPGSMSTQLTGFLTVTYDYGGTLNIVTSSVESLDDKMSQPLGALASWAVKSDTPLGLYEAAQRDVVNEITGVTSLSSDGSFSASSFQTRWLSGKIDYSYLPFGTESVVFRQDVLLPWPPGLEGVLADNPFGRPEIVFDLAGASTLVRRDSSRLNLQWTGSIAAVAVPEASSITLLSIGASCLAAWRMRKPRKSPLLVRE